MPSEGAREAWTSAAILFGRHCNVLCLSRYRDWNRCSRFIRGGAGTHGITSLPQRGADQCIWRLARIRGPDCVPTTWEVISNIGACRTHSVARPRLGTVFAAWPCDRQSCPLDSGQFIYAVPLTLAWLLPTASSIRQPRPVLRSLVRGHHIRLVLCPVVLGSQPAHRNRGWSHPTIGTGA